MIRRIGWLGVGALVLGLCGCHKERAMEKPAEKKEEKASADAAAMKVDAEMLHNLKLEKVREENRQVVLAATGKLQFNEDEVARIIAPVNGQVQQLSVKVGSEVRKGDRLFFLRSRDAAAAMTDYMEETKDLELALKTQRMAKDLFDHQAGSRMAVEQAQRDVDKAKVRVARTEEALHILGLNPSTDGKLDPRIPVLSPRSGTVIERSVTEGQFVQPEHDPLAIISDLSTLWALADIFEHDMRHVRVGQRAQLTTAAYPDRVFNAQVSYIGQVIDSETRTVKVRFTVLNPDRTLKPEMFASVKLFLNESEKCILVPTTAVFAIGEKSYVYRKTGENDFVRIEVKVDGTEAGRIRILAGLNPGQEIVSAGALLLRQMEARKQ
ncbi:MAG: efflux RND transporter periplasmic adaptor subunit [Acidobacteria bacterium]|nr:efflux RND transporter periplasmic adaptor subunit [Acidobacteriota bacterium]